MDQYHPEVDDELVKIIDPITEENLIILLTLTVPSDIKKMTTNLKAPILINTDSKKGCQIVAENGDYIVKYPVYEMFSNKRPEKGE